MSTLSPVDYIRPTGVAAAVAALAEPGNVALAGGHHLLTLLKRRERTATRLVDLAGVAEMHGVGTGPDGRVRIGAATTLTALLAAPELRAVVGVPEPFAALVGAVSDLGDRQSRNRVTVGGQLACGRTGNDLAAALLVLDTRVMLYGPAGPRTVACADLWPDGAGAAPALRTAELIVAVSCLPARHGSGYARMTDRATLEAVCGVAVAAPDLDDPRAAWRVAAAGLERRPARVTALESALGRALDAARAAASGRPLAVDHEALRALDGELARLATVPAGTTALDDRRAGEQYRRHMAAVLGGRAAARALGRVPRPAALT